MDKLIGRKDPEEVAPPPPVLSEESDEDAMLREVHGFISTMVRGGYETRSVIIETAVDVFVDEMPEDWLEEQVPVLVDGAIESQAEAEQTWAEATDCDRLEAAFAELEHRGVVARQNFTCCGTCGSSEIWDEIQDTADQGGAVRGYTFFHEQDTESAVEGYGLYLAYGATEEGESAALAVAGEIVTVLEAHGLAPDWDGDWNKRIHVPLDWKRRRSSTMPTPRQSQ